jgi:hypothetical protein
MTHIDFPFLNVANIKKQTFQVSILMRPVQNMDAQADAASPTVVCNFAPPLADDRPRTLWFTTTEGYTTHCIVSLVEDTGLYTACFEESDNIYRFTRDVVHLDFHELLIELTNFKMCGGCELVLKPGHATFCNPCAAAHNHVYVIPPKSDPNCVICFEPPVIIGKLCSTCSHLVCKRCYNQYRTPLKCPHCRQLYKLPLKRKYEETGEQSE